MKSTSFITCALAAIALAFASCKPEQKTETTDATQPASDTTKTATGASEAQTVSLKVTGMT
ncbi:MAG: hypothetical protein ACON5H_09500 [Akkermansiaceae bacterium]